VGKAPQLTATKALLLRAYMLWMAWAASSLPVPLSLRQGVGTGRRWLEQLALAPGVAQGNGQPVLIDRQGMEIVHARQKIAVLRSRAPIRAIHQRNPLQGLLPPHQIEQLVVAGALQLQQSGMKVLPFDEGGQIVRIGRPVQFPAIFPQIAKKLCVERIIHQCHDVPIYRSHLCPLRKTRQGDLYRLCRSSPRGARPLRCLHLT
jgi:hypothetical protein